MADGTSPTLSPKEAIAFGMQYFLELMERQPTSRVLLEGLSLDGTKGNWVVTFGFDSERSVPVRSSPLLTQLGALAASLQTPQVEIVREFRSVHLSSEDGKFVKMEHS
ncbi:MAG: hypothetical protein RLZZ437_1315 [Pseudomonadota bacterium]|jgi:hypothetical protein